MTDEQTVDPAVQAAENASVAAAASTETPVVEPIVEQPPAPAAAPQKSPWYLQRIAEESAKRQQEATRAADLERRLADAEALAARLQTAREGNAGDRQPIQPAPQNDAQHRAEIQQEATRQRFYEDTVEVRSRGLSQFGGSFNETLGILSAVGATSDDFVADVIAFDKQNAHTILDQIAKDPEKAAALAQMTSRQRIAEIARMTIKPAESALAAAPAPRQVSRAPAPPPPVQTNAKKVLTDYSDEMSDEEFTALFNERAKMRSARR